MRRGKHRWSRGGRTRNRRRRRAADLDQALLAGAARRGGGRGGPTGSCRDSGGVDRLQKELHLSPLGVRRELVQHGVDRVLVLVTLRAVTGTVGRLVVVATGAGADVIRLGPCSASTVRLILFPGTLLAAEAFAFPGFALFECEGGKEGRS
jgi:hypothetical protein